MRLFALGVMLALCAASTGGTAGGESMSAPLVVPCRDITAGPAPQPGTEGVRLALGVIAVPAAYALSGGAVRVSGFGRWTYWQKAGVGVRAGTFTVTVTVPKAWRSHAAITWGNGPMVSSLRFSGCGTAPQIRKWNAYVGGFYLRARSACVPLVFSVGHRSTTLRFGIGKHCA